MVAGLLAEEKMEEAATQLLEGCVALWDSMYCSRDDISFIIVKLNPMQVEGHNE